MRRTLVVAVAGMFVAGMLGAAVPAQAGEVAAPPWPLNCGQGSPSRPPTTAVYVDGTGAHVDIDAVGSDVDAATAWAVDWTLYMADCFTSRVPTGPAFCVAGVLLNAGSYFEISGSQVHLYYPALISALQGCAGV